jgi:hypothetical protein
MPAGGLRLIVFRGISGVDQSFEQDVQDGIRLLRIWMSPRVFEPEKKK